MKKILVLIVVLLVVAMASVSMATISNTRHNLASNGTFVHTIDTTVSVCGFCHIPHGGINADGVPLWARSLPLGGSFTVYGTGAQTLTGTSIGAPGTYSLTCLSCHDGSISVGTIVKNGVSSSFGMDSYDSFFDDEGGLFNSYVGPDGTKYNIGKDLRDDHPVGFAVVNYNNATGAGPGITNTKLNTGAANADFGASAGSFPLFQNASRTDSMECATCHDPHLESTGTQTKFLRRPNAGICTDCHNTK